MADGNGDLSDGDSSSDEFSEDGGFDPYVQANRGDLQIQSRLLNDIFGGSVMLDMLYNICNVV